jgi:hypothetical protein
MYTRVGSGGMLKGVEQVLPEMRVGDRWKLSIPPELAFGAKGRPASAGKPRINGDAKIDFEVEMVSRGSAGCRRAAPKSKPDSERETASTSNSFAHSLSLRWGFPAGRRSSSTSWGTEGSSRWGAGVGGRGLL